MSADPEVTREITPGTPIEIRDAFGYWRPTIALSRVHLNTAHARRNPYLVVSVKPGNWDHPINWPAEDVRRLA